jgi:DNA-binding CsgD family transcriptional regulator/PAS domain-containing protein
MTASARITDTTVLALVEQIYDAATDPTRWHEFLSAFARAVGGQGTLIFAHNVETMEASTAFGTSMPTGAVNFDPTFLQSLGEHYNFVNVWAQNEEILLPGRAVTGSMLYPVRDLPKTEFGNDWLRPQDLFHAVGGLVVQDGPWAVKFSCLRSDRQGDYDCEEIRLYQELLPHLARAAHIQRRFAFLHSLSSSSLAVLDTVPAGVILLDARGRVLHANGAAEQELRRADPLSVVFGELRSRGPARAQNILRAAIAAALDPVRGEKEKLATVARLTRRSGEALSAQALPLSKGKGAIVASACNGQLAACALIINSSRSSAPSVSPQILRHLYGLTPAESRVATLIAKGKSVPQAADELGVSRNTLKTQLKSVFAKTGARRQGDLIRLWFGGMQPRVRTEDMPR